MSKTILIVEDQKSVALMTGRLLEGAGYRYEHAIHGGEAIDMLKQGLCPDMILLDIIMPVMNGFEFLDELRRDGGLCNTPVVMLTGRGEAADVLNAVRRGAADYVTKPVESEELLSRIKQVFDRCEAAAAG